MIIGRKREIAELLEQYEQNRARLVAVYGRRRVGKTFLIDEALKGKITFRHAGLSPVDSQGKANNMKKQLKNFHLSLKRQGLKEGTCPTSWLDAFFLLERHLESQDDGSRQVVFFDEFPWMDTPRAGFLTAFESFWNGWACHRDNLMVIVCGSASSWIQDKLINNHGGLYGRLSHEIKLSPFTLQETEEFFKSKGIVISRYDIVQSYMILGGIPYYLDYFLKEYSFGQNIDRLFFGENPKLHDEFDRLFASIFSNPEEMKKIIRVLAQNRGGYTRSVIAQKAKIPESGYFSKSLEALIASDFIEKYIPFGAGRKDAHYRLIDPFCRFHLQFIAGDTLSDPYFWTNNVASPRLNTWRGFAFEDVCLRHIDAIKRALGIGGVISEQASWSIPADGNQEGSQLDLIIKRKDNVVNLCEMKFYSEEFAVTSAYRAQIAHRINLLVEQFPPKYVVHSTLVTTYGLRKNEYQDAFQQCITMDDLFR